MLADISVYIQSGAEKHRDDYRFNHAERIGNFLLKPAIWIAPHLDEIIFEGSSYSLKSISAIVASLVLIPLTLVGLAFKKIGEYYSIDGDLRREYTKSLFLYDKYAIATGSNQKTSNLEKALANHIEYFLNRFSSHDVGLLVQKIQVNNDLFQMILSSKTRLPKGSLKPHPLRKLYYLLKSEQAVLELDHLLSTWKDVNLFDLNHFVWKNLPFFVSQMHDPIRAQEFQKKLFTLSQKIADHFGEKGSKLSFEVFYYAKGLFSEEKNDVVLFKDVLSEIFLILSKKEFPERDIVDIRRDLEAVSLVCKGWERAASKVKGLLIDRQDLSLVDFTDKASRAIASMGRYNSNHGNLSDFPNLSNQNFTELARIRPNLTHLSIQSDRITDLSLHLFVDLQSLTICGCKNYPEATFAAALPSLKKLKKLELIDCQHFTGDYLKHAASLTQLKFFNIYRSKMTSINLKEILSYLSELESLNLLLSAINEDHLDQLTKSLNKDRLKELKLSWRSYDVPRLVVDFILNFPNLEGVTFRHMIIDPQTLLEVCAKLPHIHSLNLGSGGISLAPHTFSGLKRIKRLQFNNMPNNYKEINLLNGLTFLSVGPLEDLTVLPNFDNLRTLKTTMTSDNNDKLVACFQKMKYLKHLVLQIKDRQPIPSISHMIYLKSICLHCEVTADDFLKSLTNLPRLQRLFVYSSHLTQKLFDRTVLLLPQTVDLVFYQNNQWKFERKKHYPLPSDYNKTGW